MTKREVLAFATVAHRDKRVVRVTVVNRPYTYVGRVTRVWRDAVQIYGTAHGFKGELRVGHYFVRANGVSITDEEEVTK